MAADFAVSQRAARPPRLWPGILIVLLYWATLKIPTWFFPGTMAHFMIGIFGSMGCAALFLIWWLFFSRVTWLERFFGLAACLVVGMAIGHFYDVTVKGERPDQTFMGLTFSILPVVYTGWILWMWLARSSTRQVRWVGLVVVFALTFGLFTGVRFDGVTGSFAPEYSLRWNQTPEQRYLAQREKENQKIEFTADPATAPKLEVTASDWPGFRGAYRDGKRTGIAIAKDWKQNPPKELWRRQIGPGWGAFAVVGPRLFTQEQLGDVERVLCLDAATGKEVWAHADKTRHRDNESGAGPRSTPTFADGRIYSLGGTGRLNCLDASTGKLIWSHDIVADSGREAVATEKNPKIPFWGFSSSPFVSEGIVTVYAGGPDKNVLGYKADTGDLVWAAGKASDSYSSTQLAQFGGVNQLLLTTGKGITSFDPKSGKVLWDYDWDLGEGMNRCTQPALVGDSDILIGSGFGNGTRRLHVTRDGDNWKVDQVWESDAISPYYNDSVIYKDHIYGFHNNMFVCVDLESGSRKWKERGYDNGQVLLLADQGLLLVLAEDGKVALIEADPKSRKEIAKFKAMEGKTWNHPVVANGRLYVRNGQEAVCYELAPESKPVAIK